MQGWWEGGRRGEGEKGREKGEKGEREGRKGEGEWRKEEGDRYPLHPAS